MSRLVTCGFETLTLPDTTQNHAEGEGFAFVLGSNPTAGMSIDTTAPDGRGSLKFASPTADAAVGWSQAYVTDRDYFFSFVVQFSVAPAVQTILAVTRDTGFAVRLTVELATARTVKLISGAGTTLGTSAALAIATAHRVTVHYRAPSVAGPGTAGLWVCPARGTEVEVVAQGTTLTGNTSLTTAPGRFDLYVTANNATTINYDDVVLNDNQGTQENTRPPDRHQVLLRPVSDNARTGFTAGAAGTTNLQDAVKNTPPVGVAAGSATITSQLRDTGSNTTDAYDANLGAYTTAGGSGGGGLSTGDSVALVVPLVVYGTESGGVAPQVGVSGVSNPVVAESVVTGSTTSVGTFPTGWRVSRGAVSYAPSPTLGTSPVLRVRKAAAATVDVALMGLYVEYVPGTGGGGGGGTPLVAPAKVALRNSIKALLKADGTTLAAHLFEFTQDPLGTVTDQIGSSTQLATSGTVVYNQDSTPSALGGVPYNIGPAVTTGGGGASGVPDVTGFAAAAVAAGATVTATLTQDTRAFTGAAASSYGWYRVLADGTVTDLGATTTATKTVTGLPYNTDLTFFARRISTTALGNPSAQITRNVSSTGTPIDQVDVTGVVIGVLEDQVKVYWDPNPAADNVIEYDIYVYETGTTAPDLPTWQGVGTTQPGGTTAVDPTGATVSVAGKLASSTLVVNDIDAYEVEIEARQTG